MPSPKEQTAIRFLEFKVFAVSFDAGTEPAKFDPSKVLIDFGYQFGFDLGEGKQYAVQFHLFLSENESEFKLAVEAVAYFQSQTVIDDAFKKSAFARQNSPAMAFPYLRAFVGTFTTNVGMNPIVLPTYNFAK